MASNCWRDGGGQPRSRPILPVRCAQPGKNASLAAVFVSPTKPIAWTPTLSVSGLCPALCRPLAIEIDERAEALEGAADDRHHQRQAERAGASEGLRRAADADPDRQARLMGTRIDALSLQCCAEATPSRSDRSSRSASGVDRASRRRARHSPAGPHRTADRPRRTSPARRRSQRGPRRSGPASRTPGRSGPGRRRSAPSRRSSIGSGWCGPRRRRG